MQPSYGLKYNSLHGQKGTKIIDKDLHD